MKRRRFVLVSRGRRFPRSPRGSRKTLAKFSRGRVDGAKVDAYNQQAVEASRRTLQGRWGVNFTRPLKDPASSTKRSRPPNLTATTTTRGAGA